VNCDLHPQRLVPITVPPKQTAISWIVDLLGDEQRCPVKA
jgi:hypothetical protein